MSQFLFHPSYNIAKTYWGEPERAPSYDLAVRNGSMVHARNQRDQKRSQSSHVPPSISCGIWFHGS